MQDLRFMSVKNGAAPNGVIYTAPSSYSIRPAKTQLYETKTQLYETGVKTQLYETVVLDGVRVPVSQVSFFFFLP